MSRRRNVSGFFTVGLGLTAALSCSRDSATREVTPPAGAVRLAQVATELRANPTIAALNRVEDAVARVESDVIRPWEQAWRRGAPAAAIRAGDALTPDWAAAVRAPTRVVDGVSEFRISAPETREDRSAAYLEQFARVADVRVRIDEATVDGDVARMHALFELRGETPSGTRRHDRGPMRLEARREGSSWRLSRLAIDGAIESLETVAGRRPTFEDRTAASGLSAVPVVERREAIRRGGYALAVEDLNGDGHVDVLVGHVDNALLFRGTGDGRFVDATASSGLQGVTLVKSAAIADLDRDGRRDVLLVRFADTRNARWVHDGDLLNSAVGDGEVLGFANRGARLERVQRVLQRGHRYDRAMPLSVADFDNDGALDLYLGFPGVRDFTNNLNRTGAGDGIVRQGLWRNQGGWIFSEASMGASLQQDEQRFPHASLATDLDGDGRPELVVVDDSGRPNVVYRNDGRSLVESATAMNLTSPGWGMGATSGDFDGDGDLDLVMTNIASSVFDRMDRVVAGLPMSPEARTALAYERAGSRGLRLYRNDGSGHFEEVTETAGLLNVGDGTAGTEWVDFNHDGWLDLYVANGLWTGDRDGDDLTSTFYRLALARALSASPKADSAMSMPGDSDPNPLLTILREFRGRFDGNANYRPDGPSLSFAGNEHHRLFRNNGDGTFTEVAYLENADRAEDGYVVAPADLDGDGVVDLVLRNCDPAPRRQYPVVVFLRNTRPADHTLRVTLRGVRDNPDGIGARVSVRVGGRTLVREIRGANGAAQGEAVATFGLGTASAVDEVEVRWPAGGVQRLGATPEGRVTVAQPR